METLSIKEQNLTLKDRKFLAITGVEKMLSVKTDMLQIDTSFGTMQVLGQNMEVSKLDLEQKQLEVKGLISSIKYLDDKKQPLFKRILSPGNSSSQIAPKETLTRLSSPSTSSVVKVKESPAFKRILPSLNVLILNSGPLVSNKMGRGICFSSRTSLIIAILAACCSCVP